MLDWAADELGLKFIQTGGIVHRPQLDETLDGVRALALATDDMTLTALAEATALFGSAILALALHRGRLDGSTALDLSRLDEIVQIEAWGLDEEAAIRIAGHHRQAADLQGWFEALA
jgi:chaperone required for assembly of F1-ATPase